LEIEVPFQVAAVGGTHGLQIRRDDKTDRISVKVPAGVDNGSVIRLAGLGHPGQGGGPVGDLLLTVKVAAHPWFRREGSNLLIDVPITPSEGALGAKVEVPTLNEGPVTVTIPPGTSSGTKLRLRGKGLVTQKTKQPGDQFVAVKIVVPEKPDAATKELFEQLAEVSAQAPRAQLWQ
jgi:DnaJ-class molecular chaperone